MNVAPELQSASQHGARLRRVSLRLAVLAAQLACSVGLLFWVHRDAFNPILRHWLVEEGNISLYAGDVLDERPWAEKWRAIIACDGIDGRYRPAFFAFYTVPFLVTEMKNGHFQWGTSRSEWVNRLNGDRRVATLYDLLAIGVALFCGALVVQMLTGSVGWSLIFPSAVIFSPTVTHNVLRNDTAEVPQLCFGALYLVTLVWSLKSGRTRMAELVVTLVAALLAGFCYLSKETSVIFLPVFLVGMGCVWGLRRCVGGEPLGGDVRRRVGWHVLIHAVWFSWCVWNIRQMPSGGYSGGYGSTDVLVYAERLDAYLSLLRRNPLSYWVPLVGILAYLSHMFLAPEAARARGGGAFLGLGLVAMFYLLGLGFVVINTLILPQYFGHMERSVSMGFMQRVSVHSQAATYRRWRCECGAGCRTLRCSRIWPVELPPLL